MAERWGLYQCEVTGGLAQTNMPTPVSCGQPMTLIRWLETGADGKPVNTTEEEQITLGTQWAWRNKRMDRLVPRG